LNHAPAVRPFRAHFLYDNFAYEILGQVVEKLSNTTFAEALRARLADPLSLGRTCYTDEERNNEAKPYMALEDGSVVRIRPALMGEGVLMGPAGGIRSSVNDLLSLYKAFIDAARQDMTIGSRQPTSTLRTSNPIKNARGLMTGYISLPSRSLREQSYAFGWARAQLPALLEAGDKGENELNRVVGRGAPSKLALYHGGSVPGYNTYTAVFPEADSAVLC
jgi:CubicO group peptidase (beta-lactamase class C family)